MRSTLHTVLVLSAVGAAGLFCFLGVGSTSPDEARWPELTKRIAASDPRRPEMVRAGSEPPRFAFPLPEKPALPLLGSSWWGTTPGAQPRLAHLYYAPSARTEAVSKALSAKLAAAGYARIPRSGFANGFVGNDRGFESWCLPAKASRLVELHTTMVESLPALDVRITMDMGSWRCGTLAGPDEDSPIPRLGNVPALRMGVGNSGGNYTKLDSTATIRTEVPASEAAARLAERFTAKGWKARPAVVHGSAIVQHFSIVKNYRRWDAVLELVSRGDGLYDAALAVTGETVRSGAR